MAAYCITIIVGNKEIWTQECKTYDDAITTAQKLLNGPYSETLKPTVATIEKNIFDDEGAYLGSQIVDCVSLQQKV